jgi:uncharacterized protein
MIVAITDRLMLASIGFYRRFLSPYKGFRCAYGAVYGRGSCSDVVLRVARRYGGLRAFQLSWRQAARCRDAFAVVQHSDPERERLKNENPNKNLAAKCFKRDGYVCLGCSPWP